MLSKKMAFSLTSLITILALVFVVSSAYSAFDVAEISAVDVSEADDVQIEYGSDTIITIKFAEVVTTIAPTTAGPEFALTDIDVIAYNAFGGVVPAPAAVTDLGDLSSTKPNGKDFKCTLASVTAPTDANKNEIADRVVVSIAAGAVIKSGGVATDTNKAKSATFFYVGEEPDSDPTTADIIETSDPTVVSITRSTPIGSTLASAFITETVTGPFQVKIVLSEKPKDAFNAASLDVKGGTVDSVVVGVPFMRMPSDITSPAKNPPTAEGGYTAAVGEGHVPNPSGRDAMYYPYLATITPDGKEDMVTIKVKDFVDLVKPRGTGTTADPEVKAGQYKTPPDSVLDSLPNGRQRLKVKTAKDPAAPKTSGTTIYVHHRDGNMIPANGFNLVLYDKDKAGSGIAFSDEKDDENKSDKQAPAQLQFNTRPSNEQMPNLETFLSNGGTIDLMGPDGTASGSVIISEIMWGSDASIEVGAKSQWIELQNMTSSAITIAEKKWSLVFYSPADTLPATGYTDRIGTVGASGYWTIAGKGQSGRSVVKEGDPGSILNHVPIISMQRLIDATGKAGDGTMAASWVASTPPAVNFKSDIEGVHVATPGAAPISYPAPPPPDPEPVADPVVPVAMTDDIAITEIMVDSDDGKLPQWIELTNVGGKEVKLDGWMLDITNEADALSGSIEVDLSGTMLGVSKNTGNMGKGNSLLIVAWSGRVSPNLENVAMINAATQLKQTGRYMLLSEMAFKLALVPPQTSGVTVYSDMAGNLGAADDWALPMAEGMRSSLIRREMLADGMATMGTAANGWVLASSTSLASGPLTWYGSDEDEGTPGHDAGGPLPVELSSFRPARDKQTGAVVITWSTQSELNNAGFFIKRSQQREGEFKVINATMIAGAGTTSEKQFYTYTDTTAQPNVVYYYQIEDVSLDGNRQTLTRGIRLKGHVGAAGKATTLWGELKTSHE